MRVCVTYHIYFKFQLCIYCFISVKNISLIKLNYIKKVQIKEEFYFVESNDL